MATRSKISCDFTIKSSPTILFNFLIQPDQLAQWFAEKVDANEKVYTFSWNGYEEKARLRDAEENVFVRYEIEGYESGEYLEFRIQMSEISNDLMLIVTDFTDSGSEKDQILYWTTQIEILQNIIGAGN